MLSGGVTHDFPVLSPEVVRVLGEVGIEATVRDDVEAALADLGGVDLLVFNLLRWRMSDGKYADRADEFGISIDPATQESVEAWVRAGGAVLALHAASICFDDWSRWREVVGARWVWGTSHHPPLDTVEVTVHPDRHVIVSGLAESFVIEDEVYGFLDYTDDVVPLLTATHTDRDHPLLWARHVGSGRVVHDTLGHHVASYAVPTHRRIVQRSALWALGRSGSDIAAV